MIILMRCIVLKQSSAWVIPSSRSFEEEGLSPREKYFNFSKKHRKRGMRYMLQCLPTWCTDKPAPLTWCRTEYARCTIETRDPVDGQTSIYRCGLASLNDLRIWNVQPKCLLRLFPLGCQECMLFYICTIISGNLHWNWPNFLSHGSLRRKITRWRTTY